MIWLNDTDISKEKLQIQLAKLADKKKKIWWENYVKHNTIFRGVGIPLIRAELKNWYQLEKIDTLSLEKQLDLALSFFAEKYTEDKLVGILFLQIYLYDKFDYKLLLSRFESIFNKKYIFDWNVCDWLCIRVLGAMIDIHGMPCAKEISKWNLAKNLWQARCSVVAFANLAKKNQYTSLLLESNKKLIMRKERFAKTAVGWILRELSKVNEQIVINFIKTNKEHFSKESFENSIKYFKANKKQKIREIFA